MSTQALESVPVKSKVHIPTAPSWTPEQFIASKALGYLVLKVGDATAIDTPRRVEDHFEVEVYLSYEDTRLGRLSFTPDGVLIPELSTSVDEMQKAADAP